MPAASNGICNGSSEHKLNGQLLKKKLIAMDEEMEQANCHSDGQLEHQEDDEQQEVFLDTGAMANVHRTKARHSNADTDSEPLVIFDGQSNTSIAQTAKDQFAAALLRLQLGLDDSVRRLESVEAKMGELLRQQSRSQAPKQTSDSNNKSKRTFESSHVKTLIYLGWPVVVFVAMRALERRSFATKVMS